MEALGKDRIGPRRGPRTPVASEEDEEPASIPPTPDSSAPESKRQRNIPLGRGPRGLGLLFFLGLAAVGGTESTPQHQPFRWLLQDPAGGRVIKEKVTAGAPIFSVSIDDLFPTFEDWSFPPRGFQRATYWCPGWNPGKSHCAYPGYLFCGSWGCESIVTSDRWKPAEEDAFLRVRWGPRGCKPPRFAGDGTPLAKSNCSHLDVEILHHAHEGWAAGRTWSVFVHKSYTDPGAVVEIIRLAPQVPQNDPENVAPDTRSA